MPRVRHNWQRLKALYVSGEMSCKQLAEQEGISASLVENRCRKDGWVAARMAYREKTMGQALAKAGKKDAAQLQKLMGCAQELSRHLEKALADPDLFRKYVVSVGDWRTECKTFDRADMKAILDAYKAFQIQVEITRNLYDMPTQEAKHAQRIAAGRLAAEKRKLRLAEEAARQKDGSGGMVIALEPEVGELAE